MSDLDSRHPIWKEIYDMTSSIGYGISQRYRRYAELDDIRQAMNEYAWKRKDKVQEYLLRDDPDEKRMGYKAFSTFIRRAGERFARKEKAKALGYELGDEYFYRLELIESLIKVVGSGEAYLANQVFDPDVHGVKNKKLANEGNNLIAMISDVDRAMKKLDLRMQGILNARFANDQPLNEIAAAWDISPQRVEQLVAKGVRDIAESLGGKSPY
jgi:DNA-directed RNA polymerase specialized sigma subunit